MGDTISFSRETYNDNAPIIVYGASVYGELAYVALKQMGIHLDYYCDQSQKRKEYFGVEVITPEKLDDFKNANIIIASADFFREIKIMLVEKGFEYLFDMRALLELKLPKEKLSNRALEMYDNKQYYFDIVHNQSKEKLVFNRIQYVVTERCSLRCRDCSHLIQYYQHPKDIDLDRYKESFDLLLKHVDRIAELRILGGEPFMNGNMEKLIDWYYDCNKIQGISVYTNGTIIPNEKVLKKLKKDKVKVHISDYKINKPGIKRLANVFDEYHIVYFVRNYDAWQEAGGVECRNRTLEEKKALFAGCFERNGYTFLKGQLHRCPRSAHAMNLKAMPDIKEEYVDLLNWCGTEEELKEKLRKLQERSWLESCNYCGGPDNHAQGIPAAIQISAPIAYDAKY
jgi:organic radical activating enzyme